jgi:phosphatidate phosphatase PAH1
MSRWNNKIVIFDLDGTLADISVRRNLATKDNGKLDVVK